MPRRACIPSFALAASIFCFAGASYPQQPADGARDYSLPCQPTALADSADGTSAWFACEQTGIGPLVSDWVHPNSVYSLDLRSGQTRKISEGHGVVSFLPAPQGSQAIMTRSGEKRAKRALLVDGRGVVKELPILTAIDWSPEGKKLYFEAGSTIEAEVWNILGILNTKDLSVESVQLPFAAESLYVCRDTGKLYFGDPALDKERNLKFDARVFDPSGKLESKLEAFPPGTISSKCRYVATEGFLHGPMPWEIVEVASGKLLVWFADPGDSNASWVNFVAWNPRRESLYLRTTNTPVKGNASATVTALQVVDAADDKVLAEYSEYGDLAIWSSDGASFLVAKGNQLRKIPVASDP